MPDNHIIGSGLTEQQLRLASWWTRHGLLMKRLGYGSLISFCALTWVYTLWIALDTYAISYPRESRITQTIAANGIPLDTLNATAPRALQVSPTLTLSSTDNRTDLVAQISNANTQWWAEFTYQFSMNNGTSTAPHQGYILPSSQRYLTELGSKAPVIGGASLKISNLQWHRVNPEDVNRDYAAFAAQHLQLSFDAITYQNNQTSFTLHNASAYGFWSVDVTILLYRSDVPVAVTTLNLKNILPGESRPVSINWSDNLSGVSKTDVRADVNILDPNSYLSSQQF